MPQAVKLPDGNLIHFPDEMSQEEITAAMPKAWEQAQAKSNPDRLPQPEDTTLASSYNRYEKENVASANKDIEESTKPFKADSSPGPNWLQYIGQKGGAITGRLSKFFSPATSAAEAGVENVAAEAYNAGKPEDAGEVPQEDLQKAHNVSGVIGSTGANILMTLAPAELGQLKSVKDIRSGISKVNDVVRNKTIDGLNWATSKTTPDSDFSALGEANKGTKVRALFGKAPNNEKIGLDTIQSLSKHFDKANTQANTLYTAQKLLGEGKTTPAEDVAVPLAKTIEDLEQSAVTPQQSASLRRLKAIQEKYFTNPDTSDTISGMSVAGETITPKAPEMEVNDLVEIKQALNEGFKSNDFTKSSEIPLVKLHNIIQNKFNSLETTLPDFYKAGKAADTFYGNEVALKFKDNSELQDLWQPEDHYAWKKAQDLVKNPGAKGYTDATLTRAGKLLDTLNSGENGRISALINALPRDEAIEVLNNAIVNARIENPSLLTVARNLMLRGGTHGTVGTPVYSAEQSLRSFLGTVLPSNAKKSPLIGLAEKSSPKSNLPVGKAVGAGAIGYLGYKSFGGNNKGKNNAKPQSNNTPIGATNSALASSKKNNDGFQLSDLNPIGTAEAAEIKVPENSPISSNVKQFMTTTGGGPELQSAIKRQGATASEIMTVINAESSVKKTTGNGYAQITPAAWKQAEQVLGRNLNRKNSNDYADATVAYYKWTAEQVKHILGSAGTPSVKDVYTAYNAGIGGFKSLHKANPAEKSINVVPKDVSQNNKHFYYNKNGTPLTVKQTIQAYRDFVNTKMNEYSPAPKDAKTSTALALAKAQTDGEPDMEPSND